MTGSAKSVARKLRLAAAIGTMGVALLAGCKSKEQKAIDQAKAQAASTGQAQQVQYIDANGDTSTTVVQPPVAGQAQTVDTKLTPPAPGPKPHQTDPVVTPYQPAAQSPAAPDAMMAMTGPPAAGTGAAMTGPAMTGPDAAMTGPAMSGPAMTGNAMTGNAMTGPTAPATSPDAPDTPYTAPPAETLSANAPAVNVTIPAGTTLAIRINQHISVKHNHAGDRFTGEVVEPVSINGSVAIARGTHVGGRVDEAHRRGHFKGRSILELRLTSIELNGNRYALATHDNVHTKKGKGKRSGAFIGGMTGAGMLIGGLATGGVGLAVGGAAGAGAGTLLAGVTGNRDIEIPAESVMRFRLSDALYVQNAQ